MRKFWKRASVEADADKRDYLKEIEEKIEAFRIMSEEEQRKNIRDFASSIKNNLVEGNFDNKIHIKYLMRFIKVIKMQIRLEKSEIEKSLEISNSFAFALVEIISFIGGLRGVEESKEDGFLNHLNHEEKVSLNTILINALDPLCAIIEQPPSLQMSPDQIKDFFDSMTEYFKTLRHNTAKIIGRGLEEITKQEKINRLKIASRAFKIKANLYRSGFGIFLLLAAFIVYGVFASAYFTNLFDLDIKFPEKNNININTFYIYLMLKFVFSGRLLFSIIVLTGFFYCIRFSAASQHNAIICDQRVNTLEAFEALYENVEEDKEKLLVVEKVLNSATEHLPTGFSKQQSDSGGIAPSSLLSLLKLKK